MINCARCGTEVKDGHDLCPLCEEHVEFHTGRCVDCVPRDAAQDGQEWWRGYHSRDSEVDQLIMQIARLKREAQNAKAD